MIEVDLGIEKPAGRLRHFEKVEGVWRCLDEDAPKGWDVCFCCGFPYCIRIPRAGLGGKTLQQVLEE